MKKLITILLVVLFRFAGNPGLASGDESETKPVPVSGVPVLQEDFSKTPPWFSRLTTSLILMGCGAYFLNHGSEVVVLKEEPVYENIKVGSEVSANMMWTADYRVEKTWGRRSDGELACGVVAFTLGLYDFMWCVYEEKYGSVHVGVTEGMIDFFYHFNF